MESGLHFYACLECIGTRDRDLYSHPPSSNIFPERIMTDALEGTVSIGGRIITNLCFADDIDGLAGDEEELATLVERLDKASTAYGMEISAAKTKLMTTTTSSINTEIKVNGQKLVTVSSFCPFTLISVLMPLVLFVISLVFAALISMP